MGAFKIKKNGSVYENNKMPGAYPGERVTYDNTESGLTAEDMQSAVDEVVEIKVNKTDLTSISQNEATATQAIPSGTYFYLNGVLVRAKTAIASGATFTLNTNYVIKTVGDALNEQTTVEEISTGISGVTAYKVGKVVTLIVVISNMSTTINGWNDIGTLPASLRPPVELYFSGIDNLSASLTTNSSQLRIRNGVLQVYAFTGQSPMSPYATITYITNS